MAHGLVLKLEEMLQRNLVCRKDSCEVLSEEDRIIKSWAVTNQPKFYKLEFYRLLRKTLLCVLSPQSLKEPKKRELLNGMAVYFNRYSKDLRNNLDIHDIGKHLTNVIRDPWQNLYFSWDEFFQQKISINDQKVQEYFANEPEDIVMARVHAFVIQGKEEMAMILAKCSYMYHSRIAKNLFAIDTLGHKVKPESVLLGTKYKKGIASIDWYLFILQRKKLLPAIVNEIKQLTCHEGVQLIHRLRRSKKNQSFIFTMLQILIMQELIQSSKYCCTKKIFSLWCLMHKEKKSGAFEINHAIRKMLALHAPSSAHFYLFADSLWEQFGSSLITLYVELYVRGLTVDLNHLEAAKHREDREDINALESHIALIFSKLSTLFSDFHEGAARECMFSAFSLKPTKERLYILQSLTHSILSTENEIKLSYSINVKTSSQECKCDVRCDGHCQGNKEFCLEHPILKKGIPNVPFLLVKDLVCVLEGVRCFQFQYNIFDWHNNATDLGDYLKDYNLMKSWESDTEYASEGSSRSDLDDSPEKSSCPVPQMNERPFHLSSKRKNEPSVARELYSFDVGANVEVRNNNLHKKMKMLEYNVSSEINSPEVFNRRVNSVQNFASSVGMEDAIENVIRMSLDTKQKPDILMNNNNFMTTSLDRDHDGIKNLSLPSVSKHLPGNHVYPYSLTSLGKGKHLNSNYNSPECSEKSSPENTREYMPNFPSKLSNVYEATSHVNRESVISPVVSTNNFIPIQEQSCKSSAQNKQFAIKTENISSYSYSNDNIPSNVYAGQKISSNALKKVSMYQQLPYNLGSNKQISVYYSNAQSSLVPGKEMGGQILSLADGSTCDYPKSQFISNTPISSSSSMTSPANIQSKESSMQHSVYPSTSHSMSQSSMYRSDSRYRSDHSNPSNTIVMQIDPNVSCYEDNQLVSCDRNSVIQHTMHVQENSERDELTIPSQLTVSVNANAAEQIRCAPQKDVTNLPPFTVNVSDRAISGSSVAVSANLVINRKYQQFIDLPVSAPQPVNNIPVTNSETITIPGILASPSVIVTPWETQIKSHGEMMYKKNIHVVNAYAVDKKIYRNRPPYMKQIILKPEQKISRQIVSADKTNLKEVFKTIPSTNVESLGSLPSTNQSQPNSNQNWQMVEKTSSQGVSKPTSNQQSNIQNWQLMNKSMLQGASKPTSIEANNIQNWQVVSKPTPQLVSKPTPQVMTKSMQQVVSKPMQQVVSKPMHQVVSKPMQQVVSKPTPQVVSKPMPQVVSKPTPQVVSKPTPQVVSKPTPQVVSKPTPQVVSKPTPQVVSKPTLQVVSKPTLQVVSKATPQVVSKAMPQVVSKAMPQVVSKAMPQVVSKAMPQAVSKAMPQAVSKAMPQAVSKPMPQVVSKPMLQLVSKQMPQVVKKSTPQMEKKSTQVVKKSQLVVNKSTSQVVNKSALQMVSKTPQVASKSTPQSVLPSSQSSSIQNWQVVDKSTLQGISKPTLSQPSNIQNWQVVNKSTSQLVSKPTSSQPWYSEPYPKHSVSESNTASKQSASSSTVHTSPNAKLMQSKQISNMKSFSVFANEAVALAHGSNPVPDSTVKSSHFSNVSHSPNLTVHTSSKEPLPHKDFIASPSSSQLASTKSMKFSVAQCNILQKHSTKLPNEFTDSTTNTILVQEKNPDVFTTSNIVDINRHFCHMSSENFPNMCCSPTEVNPCQTCSLPPTEVNSAQASSQKSSNCTPDQHLPTPNQKKMMSESTSVASAFHSSSQSKDDGDATRIMLSDSDIGEALATCQYCSQCFAARELEVHILNCRPKDFNNENYDTVIGTNEMVPENECALKTLPDVVPVQDALFHMESFPNNLPHSKSFVNSSENQQVNVEDVKNFEAIEANAFSVCMDLINSDQDLKRIVQGIESLDQMENNYLTFMPSAGAPNILNSNIDTEVQKHDKPAVTNQNLAVCDKDELNNSAMQSDDPEFVSGRIHSVNSRGNVFEFTEKDYEASKPAQKLIHSKPQTLFAEKISPNCSKNIDEAVTFSTIAEMIKATISHDCNGELEPFETLSKVTSKDKPHEVINPPKTELEFWICQYCSKKLRSASSLKRHILKLHPNENADGQVALPQKFDSVSPAGLSHNCQQTANDLSVNSSHIESSSSVTPIATKSLKMSSNSEISPLSKGRIKGITKSTRFQCKICGKVLSAGYMKTHISKQHSEQQNDISIKTEISSSDPYDATVSSSSQVESSNFPTVSTVTEQDIDSSTCLSASDALKRNGSYTIADASNLSNGSDKVSESTNVKFNFNDLEFSRDTHADGKASTSEEDQNLFPKLETSFPENVESEENNVKPNVVYARGGFVFRNHFCTACPKAYSSATTLRKHMKTVHNLDHPRAPRKGKKLTTNLSLTTFEAKHNMQPMNIPENKETIPQVSKKVIPSTSKTATPIIQIYSMHKSGVKFKKPLPNPNSNLLKSVLVKSIPANLKPKQLKNLKYNYSKAMERNASFEGSINVNHVLQTPVNKQKICNEQLNNINSNLPLVSPDNERNVCNEQLKDNICSDLPLKISENVQNICNEQLSGDFNSNLPIQTFENEQNMCNELLSDNLNYNLFKFSADEQLDDNVISDHPIQISENDQKLCNELNKNSESMQLDAPLNSDFESGCNLSDSVPSENLQTGETESVQATSNFLVPGAVSNIPSEAEQLDYFQLNTILPSSDILQTKHFNPPNSECNVDCENASVQSNEISPVSEIISNVSKYQFGGPSNDEDRKEFLDDNSLKLSIPKNQRMPVNPENKNFQNIIPPLLESKPKVSNNESNNSDLPYFSNDCLLDTNQNINGVETIESLTEDIACKKRIPRSSGIKCRLCHQSLSSINSLTKHLKEVHDIPVLKKHISQPPAVKLSTCVQESVKRSPPKLKLGPNESDSESVSDFDNPPTYHRAKSEQLENISSTHKVLDNSCITHLSPSEQCMQKTENTFIASGFFESLVQLEHTETEIQPKQPDPLHFLISDSECQGKPVTVASPCKYKFRRHSFCDTKSFFLQVKNNKSLSTAEINHLISNVNFKNNCEIIKMKSVSLPNFQVTLKHVTASCIEHEMNKTDTSLKSVDCLPDENNDHPVKQSEVAVEDSTGENKLSSSIDVPEVIKTSCDISSESYPVQLNTIAIDSDFLLPNPLLNSTSQLPPTQPTKRKILHRKLLLKKIKSYKSDKIRRVKSKYFSYHKALTHPIILTLKKTAEISEFLKTHKQPTVKLMRLKENSDGHSKSVIKEVPLICDKYPLKEAVVKLERLKIPKDFGDLILVKQKHVPGVLSQKSHFNSVTMQNAENRGINFSHGFYLRSSTVHANPPIEIDLTDSNSNSDIVSCDAHQNVEALAMEVKCPFQTEGCTAQLPKKCFVVLKRISV